MMYPRLELLRELLSEDGSIWVTLDDNEAHYFKVIADKVFGRKNFIADIAWNHRKSVQNDVVISLSHNHVLAYGKNRRETALNRLEVDGSKYANPDADPRGPWSATPSDAPNIRPNLTYAIRNPNTGEDYLPPKGRCWRTSENEYLKLLANGEIVFGKNGRSKPQQKRFLGDAAEKGQTVKTWWDDVGTATEATKELQKIAVDFDTPKPERLLQRVLEIATNPGELVLGQEPGASIAVLDAHLALPHLPRLRGEAQGRTPAGRRVQGGDRSPPSRKKRNAWSARSGPTEVAGAACTSWRGSSTTWGATCAISSWRPSPAGRRWPGSEV